MTKRMHPHWTHVPRASAHFADSARLDPATETYIQGCEWTESAGGPLVLAPQSCLPHWRGTAGSNVVGAQSDYERACAIGDEIGMILIGDVTAAAQNGTGATECR